MTLEIEAVQNVVVRGSSEQERGLEGKNPGNIPSANYTYTYKSCDRIENGMLYVFVASKTTSTFEYTHLFIGIDYNCDDKCYIIINIKFKPEYTAALANALELPLVMVLLLQQRHSYLQLCEFLTQFCLSHSSCFLLFPTLSLILSFGFHFHSQTTRATISYIIYG